jgi:hypothetical protein
LKELEKIDQPLPIIAWDKEASTACRENNDAILKEENKEPVPGGNMERYKTILGEKAKTPDAIESTYVQWSGHAHELILLNLLQEYEKATEDKKAALVDPKLVKVGMSFKAHKKLQNIFQIIYVKQSTNIMA